jgi:hypothetical protein
MRDVRKGMPCKRNNLEEEIEKQQEDDGIKDVQFLLS